MTNPSSTRKTGSLTPLAAAPAIVRSPPRQPARIIVFDQVFGLDVGTDDAEPVELLLVSDPGFVALEREGLVGDGGDEVLGDLVVVDDLADAHADGGGPA